MDLIQEAASRALAAGGWLPAAVAKDLVQRSNRPIEQLLLDLIPLASRFAQPALSGFQVGAVAQGESGAIYLGANFEFAACPLNQTVHAEQATVVNAAAHGETGIARLAVSAAPCGYCRQFLYELASASRLQILLADRPPTRLIDYLPGAFGPGDLGVQAGLLSPQRHPLQWASSPAPTSTAAQAALKAASTSYAPYTKAVAGVGLTTRDGRTFAGPYLENAAFNPSISPLQAAIVLAVLGGQSPADITEIAVTQTDNTPIDHAAAARLVLHNLAPNVVVQQYPIRVV